MFLKVSRCAVTIGKLDDRLWKMCWCLVKVLLRDGQEERWRIRRKRRRRRERNTSEHKQQQSLGFLRRLFDTTTLH